MAALAMASACTLKDQSAPSLTGPSEFGLSLSLTASPDVLNLDGTSQALIAIIARDSEGRLSANVTLRVDTAVPDGSSPDGWRIQSIGRLSATNIVTGSDGRASVTYTAPASNEPVDNGAFVYIVVRPIGTNYDNTWVRTLTIRLVPTGQILPPNGTPEPAFTVSSPVRDKSPVTFDASSTRDDGTIVSYSWNFGDGTSGSGVTTTHTYSVGGNYTVTLTVTDDRGLSASTSQPISVSTVSAPTADFTYSPTTPSANQLIYFNAAISVPATGRTIASYGWEFGDGASGTGQYPTHKYALAGAYVVTLTVTDDVGKTGVASKTVTISSGTGGGEEEPTALSAGFTFSPATPSVGQSVFFHGGDSTTPVGTTITSYVWDFGDGSSASGLTTNHTYSAGGNYQVRLTITNSAGESATTTLPVPVSSTGAVLLANFTFSPIDPNSGDLVSFNANTSSPISSIVSYDWDFGDGTLLLGQTSFYATHTYLTQSDHTYTVRLTVYDSSGRLATTTKTVPVAGGLDPTAAFTITPSPAQVGVAVTFDGSPSTVDVFAPAGTTIVRYEWLFGDGTALTSTTAPTTTITHAYATAGTYVISLTVVDSNGRNGTTTRTLVVQ